MHEDAAGFGLDMNAVVRQNLICTKLKDQKQRWQLLMPAKIHVTRSQAELSSAQLSDQSWVKVSMLKAARPASACVALLVESPDDPPEPIALAAVPKAGAGFGSAT